MNSLKIPYTNFQAEYAELRPELLAVVERIMISGAFILRDDLKAFEQSLCRLTGARHAVGVGSGYDALLLALESLGIKPQDEVILPAYSFVATANAVLAAGGVPVFADCGPDLNLDPRELPRLVTAKTRAVIPVHLHGRPCDMLKILSFCREHALAVVEDAAQAFGSTLNEKWLGTFGDFGCFSLHPLKSLSIPGDGGFILTDREEKADWLRSRRDHGRQAGKYCMAGINSRLDNLFAALANLKLKYFETWAAARRDVAAQYAAALSRVPGVQVLSEPPQARVVWSSYPVICKNAAVLRNGLLQAGIETLLGLHAPLHALPWLPKPDRPLPRTDEFANRVLLLPLHPFLKPDDIACIVRMIRERNP